MSDKKVKLLLLLIVFGLLFLPMGRGNFFGSEGDWLSQHVAVAESLRQIMIEQHSLLPQWIGLGGGSSSYDFAYYGLLRPDVLISCLLPQVQMRYIIAGYAALGVAASAVLTWLWLKRRGRSEWISFAGAVLLVSAACFYQAHHQIMFVNYMPFLILALMGTERLADKGKIGLLAVSLVLVIVHSFYYSPAAICVVMLYGIHLRAKKSKVLLAVSLAISMTAVLLLPTALAILSTSKDGGSSAGRQLEALDLSLEGLLYSPYGCGMTLLAFFCLILALGHRKHRFLAGCLLAVMAVPAVSLVLNGFLYARAKILIPFLPLLVLVCIDELTELWERGESVKRIGAALMFCFLPAFFSEWKPLVLVEGGILVFWSLWWIRKNGSRSRRFWMILLVPVCVSIGVNLSDGTLHTVYQTLGIPTKETYVRADDTTQQIPGEMTETLEKSSDYRLEILTDSFMNANILGNGEVQRTSMYSSISNADYGTFFYDVMGNAISYNNRVALVAGTNPVFCDFMGIRYVLTTENNVPWGYEKTDAYGKYILAEKKDVRPICYGVEDGETMLNREAFENLDFSEKLEALSAMTIVETGGAQTFEAHVQSWEPKQFFREEDLEKLYANHGEETYFDLRTRESTEGKVVVIRFSVERRDGNQVVISVGGVKNKLSSKSAPYPNKNQIFTFVLDGDFLADHNDVYMSAGDYTIEQLSVETIDKIYLKQPHLVTAETKTKDADADEKRRDGAWDTALVYRGTITMDEDGYFVTSYPYRKGYQIFVDEEEVDVKKVNTTFLGVNVKEGVHEIEIRFQAPGYQAGAWISLISAGGFLGALCIGRYRRIRERDFSWNAMSGKKDVWEKRNGGSVK